MSNVTEYNLSNLPTADVVKGWSRDNVKEFLQGNRTDLRLKENDINVIYDQNVTGKAFLRLKEKHLTRDLGPFKLLFGPASAIADVVKQINGGKILEQPNIVNNLRLTTFIQSLINTTFDEGANDIFELEEGVKFFGLEDEPSKLYIRKCYNHLLGVVNNSSIRKLRISGNPGIGKTLFGYYLLYHLVKKNETIVYDPHNLTDEVIVFDKSNGFYLNRIYNNTKREYLYNRDNWYIVDGKQPDRAIAKTILICSPRKDHYREFDKQSPDIRIMPVWTWEEINDCRKEIFKHLSEEVVRVLYMKWGGIPRYVLMSAENSKIQNKIQQAIKIFQFIGASDSSEDVSHMLIHMWTNVPEEDNLKEDNDNKGKGKGKGKGKETDEVKSIDEGEYYTQTIIKFASDYVGERITERFKDMIMS